ncbi:hypothetical protein FHX42_000206 [Saccharopolyspora lacisalsi]|uniref:DUF397 domain-containing protein n=2 Tax=Halosaccharopolyspora lacisalsi TaxID=1000566 RepID=A0A839DTZ9_9PSEU|nr:DUF397 domain-containing protein [Halosaccharopolyspora lacisalsi]MBA8822877.1 hypothetical protein [Halosaccharopolyspora lacisalsi]
MPSSHRDTGWFKSSRRAAANDNCVEVRMTGTVVGVRDSKNPDGGAFAVTPRSWRAFLDHARAGDFDHRS